MHCCIYFVLIPGPFQASQVVKITHFERTKLIQISKEIPAKTSWVLFLHIFHLIHPFSTNSPCLKGTDYSCIFHQSLSSAMLCSLCARIRTKTTGDPGTLKLCIWGEVCGVGRTHLWLRIWSEGLPLLSSLLQTFQLQRTVFQFPGGLVQPVKRLEIPVKM